MTELSVLISSRKNSKTLGKLLASLDRKSNSIFSFDTWVMLNKEDTWNDDFTKVFNVNVIKENLGMGRWGLHEYFNKLAQNAGGKWFIYLCDDHDVITPGWDADILNFISQKNLFYKDPHIITPMFDNTGAVNHIISRGWWELNGKRLGAVAHIDSWINDLGDRIREDYPGVFHRLDKVLFTDYTAAPETLTDAHTKAWIDPNFKHIYVSDPEYKQLLDEYEERLRNGLQK